MQSFFDRIAKTRCGWFGQLSLSCCKTWQCQKYLHERTSYQWHSKLISFPSTITIGPQFLLQLNHFNSCTKTTNAEVPQIERKPHWRYFEPDKIVTTWIDYFGIGNESNKNSSSDAFSKSEENIYAQESMHLIFVISKISYKKLFDS